MAAAQPELRPQGGAAFTDSLSGRPGRVRKLASLWFVAFSPWYLLLVKSNWRQGSKRPGSGFLCFISVRLLGGVEESG